MARGSARSSRRRTRAVLGIDAAWTAARPSGVALVVEEGDLWRCAALAPSYEGFLALAGGARADFSGGDCRGTTPSARELITAALRIEPRAEVVVAAVDMPLSLERITRRRPCDDQVSRAFARQKLGVHSPTAARPGLIADRLRASFEREGFRLATLAPMKGRRHLLEVYPHTALLALAGSPERVKYKLSRAPRYFPGTSPAERRALILHEWRRILERLCGVISGIDLPLPSKPPAPHLMKRLEDALDALLCAFVGIEFLRGRAVPLGDASAAIWSPEPPHLGPARRSLSLGRGSSDRPRNSGPPAFI